MGRLPNIILALLLILLTQQNAKARGLDSLMDRSLLDTTYVVDTIYKVMSSSRLNVREQPSVNSRILGSLLSGTEIQGSTWDSSWTGITYNGQKAYVATRYLKFLEEKITPVIVQSAKPKETDSVHVDDGLLLVETDIANEKRFYDIISVDAIADAYVGYSDFVSSQTEAIGRLGVGVDACCKGTFKEKIWIIPKGWCAEAGLGYSMKGSAAYPMHYINLKLAPFGYEYELSPVLLNANLGFFMGVPLSRVVTDKYQFRSNLDVGLYVKAMCWWRDFGLGVSYEFSFTNVCSADLPLKNSAVFLNLSYRICNINNYYSK